MRRARFHRRPRRGSSFEAVRATVPESGRTCTPRIAHVGDRVIADVRESGDIGAGRPRERRVQVAARFGLPERCRGEDRGSVPRNRPSAANRPRTPRESTCRTGTLRLFRGRAVVGAGAGSAGSRAKRRARFRVPRPGGRRVRRVPWYRVPRAPHRFHRASPRRVRRRTRQRGPQLPRLAGPIRTPRVWVRGHAEGRNATPLGRIRQPASPRCAASRVEDVERYEFRAQE